MKKNSNLKFFANTTNPGQPKIIKPEPKLLAYGSLNVYEINGKAYVKWNKKFYREPSRDYLIKSEV